jgi:hypothetical protein
LTPRRIFFNKGKNQEFVANQNRPRSKGYNIVRISEDIDAVAKLKTGREIKFSGFIRKYRNQRGRPIMAARIQVTFPD